MTKPIRTLTAAFLSVSLVSAANAYGTEPADTVATIGVMTTEPEREIAQVCAVQITPILAEILALPEQWKTEDEPVLGTALSCAGN